MTADSRHFPSRRRKLVTSEGVCPGAALVRERGAGRLSYFRSQHVVTWSIDKGFVSVLLSPTLACNASPVLLRHLHVRAAKNFASVWWT